MLTKDYIGTVCEVKTLRNALLTTGRIKTVSEAEQYVEISDEPHDMPLVPYETPLKIGVYHPEQGYRMLVGETYLSNRELLRAVNVIDFVEYERRRYFRLDIDAEATLYVKEFQREGAGKTLKVPIRVKNLSLCGMRFETDYQIPPGAELEVRMVLSKTGAEDLPVTICRIEKHDNGKSAYGVEIPELDERTEQKLCAYLFQQQQQQIRKSREAKQR